MRAAAVLALGLALLPAPGQAAEGFLQIRNGYFWAPLAGDYFIPRGVAYQIRNPPVGANQSLDQVNYDLLEFKKMHANSVRAEMTWGQVQIGPDQYDWTRPDHLVQEAEQLGLKLFVIIGYQYPPAWFPTNRLGINNLGLRADVVQCLANSTPDNALNCLPAATALALQSTNSPTVLTQVMNCLVAGAKAGGVSNIIQNLQGALTLEQLDANLPLLISDVINYEDPQAQAAYQQYIAAVTGRYQGSPAIGAWILGNEYAYFDLWEDTTLYPVHRSLGYDALSQQSFHNYLQAQVQNSIAALNANWQAAYSNFASVVMPLQYPPNRLFPGYQARCSGANIASATLSTGARRRRGSQTQTTYAPIPWWAGFSTAATRTTPAKMPRPSWPLAPRRAPPSTSGRSTITAGLKWAANCAPSPLASTNTRLNPACR